MEASCISICAYCLSSLHRAPLRRAWPDFFTSSHQQFLHWQDPSKPSLKTEQSQLSVSPPVTNAPRLCSNKALSPYTREHRTGHTTPDVVSLTDTEWKTRVPSLKLLATLCLIMPRTLLAFFVLSSHYWCIYTRITRFFPVKLLSSCSSPSLHRIFFPQVQDFAISLYWT